jgi:hypothetical protein
LESRYEESRIYLFDNDINGKTMIRFAANRPFNVSLNGDPNEYGVSHDSRLDVATAVDEDGRGESVTEAVRGNRSGNEQTKSRYSEANGDIRRPASRNKQAARDEARRSNQVCTARRAFPRDGDEAEWKGTGWAFRVCFRGIGER